MDGVSAPGGLDLVIPGPPLRALLIGGAASLLGAGSIVVGGQAGWLPVSILGWLLMVAGVAFAVAVLVRWRVTRLRVQADEQGLRIAGPAGEQHLPWAQIKRVTREPGRLALYRAEGEGALAVDVADERTLDVLGERLGHLLDRHRGYRN